MICESDNSIYCVIYIYMVMYLRRNKNATDYAMKMYLYILSNNNIEENIKIRLVILNFQMY